MEPPDPPGQVLQVTSSPSVAAQTQQWEASQQTQVLNEEGGSSADGRVVHMLWEALEAVEAARGMGTPVVHLEAQGVACEEVETHDVARQDAIGHIQIHRPGCHHIPDHCTPVNFL